jgi:hypothetical protein
MPPIVLFLWPVVPPWLRCQWQICIYLPFCRWILVLGADIAWITRSPWKCRMNYWKKLHITSVRNSVMSRMEWFTRYDSKQQQHGLLPVLIVCDWVHNTSLKDMIKRLLFYLPFLSFLPPEPTLLCVWFLDTVKIYFYGRSSKTLPTDCWNEIFKAPPFIPYSSMTW